MVRTFNKPMFVVPRNAFCTTTQQKNVDGTSSSNVAEGEDEESTSQGSTVSETGDEANDEEEKEGKRRAEAKAPPDPPEPKEDPEKKKLAEAIRDFELERTKLRQHVANLTDELANLRKRTEKEKEQMKVFAIEKFAKEILPVSDNLEYAIKQADENKNADLNSVMEGVNLTHRTLQHCLTKFEINKIDSSLGAKFDLNFHEVMFAQPDQEKGDGEIVITLREGYTIGDRVLRSAQVGVVKNS